MPKTNTYRKKKHTEWKNLLHKNDFFSHRVVIDVVDKQELMFDNQRDTAWFLYILTQWSDFKLIQFKQHNSYIFFKLRNNSIVLAIFTLVHFIEKVLIHCINFLTLGWKQKLGTRKVRENLAPIKKNLVGFCHIELTFIDLLMDTGMDRWIDGWSACDQ